MNTWLVAIKASAAAALISAAMHLAPGGPKAMDEWAMAVLAPASHDAPAPLKAHADGDEPCAEGLGGKLSLWINTMVQSAVETIDF